MNNQPIGVFDSGVGGISIWKSIRERLPKESTIYLADGTNAPYGEKPVSEIVRFSIKSTELLLEMGAKMIVVACNTATTNAIDTLRNRYEVPFIGIEPATKPAAISTTSKKIGILATKGTFASELFLNTSRRYRGSVEIIERAGTGLVEIVESGDLQKALPLLKEYVEPMLDAGVDNIVLGCTHYPFLIPVLRQFVPEEVNIIDSGAAVAKQTAFILEEHRLTAGHEEPSYRFYTNRDVNVLRHFVDQVGAPEAKTEFLAF